MGEENHVISLFVDDVLQYLRNPEKSTPAVLNFIASFSALLVYKIKDSENLLPFNMLIQSRFHVSERGVRYLGISVTPD